MNRTTAALLVALLAGSTGGCAARAAGKGSHASEALRRDALERAKVWSSTNVPAMDVRTGPRDKGAFAPNALVHCRYLDKEMSGSTPKFTCVLPNGDNVKVKYGRDNGEVYAEVAATRLLWALGFGADHMYPVRVRCTGCPLDNADAATSSPVVLFEAAAIERRTPGREIEGESGRGWSWDELDDVRPRRGGASLAERDALKLLAAMLQHTDSKREQQRLVCLSPGPATKPCARPFLLISDLGRTFGKANTFNRDKPGSVNRKEWEDTPIWEGKSGCRAHLPKSLTGTLDNPVISEGGRRMLATLLARLTDRQLRELFAVARFPMRADMQAGEEATEVDAWVKAFKDKRSQIISRSCTTS